MVKIREMTTAQLKSEMDRIHEKSIKECKWIYKNKRWKGLLNEYERRVMKR